MFPSALSNSAPPPVNNSSASRAPSCTASNLLPVKVDCSVRPRESPIIPVIVITLSLTVACAASGVSQVPPIVPRNARSHVTATDVASSSSCATTPWFRHRRTHFNRDGALRAARQHLVKRHHLRGVMHQAQPGEPRSRQDDGVVFTGFELRETRVHIAADVLQLEIGTKRRN